MRVPGCIEGVVVWKAFIPSKEGKTKFKQIDDFEMVIGHLRDASLGHPEC